MLFRSVLSRSIYAEILRNPKKLSPAELGLPDLLDPENPKRPFVLGCLDRLSCFTQGTIKAIAQFLEDCSDAFVLLPNYPMCASDIVTYKLRDLGVDTSKVLELKHLPQEEYLSVVASYCTAIMDSGGEHGMHTGALLAYLQIPLLL